MGKSLDDRIKMGADASHLLKDETFSAVLNGIVAHYIDQLMSTEPGSEKGVTAHAAIRGLNDIKNTLRMMESDGNVAIKELAKKNKA